MDDRIWFKRIQYVDNQLDPNSFVPDYQVLRKIYEYQDIYDDTPDTDYCLQEIVDLTKDLEPRKCYVTAECGERYYGYDEYATGYTLTHKQVYLLLFENSNCKMYLKRKLWKISFHILRVQRKERIRLYVILGAHRKNCLESGLF